MNLKAVGKNVVIKKLENHHDIIRGGIYIPDDTIEGFNMLECEVQNVGKDVKYVKSGMKVLVDKYGIAWGRHESESEKFAVIEEENIIVMVI